MKDRDAERSEDIGSVQAMMRAAWDIGDIGEPCRPMDSKLKLSPESDFMRRRLGDARISIVPALWPGLAFRILVCHHLDVHLDCSHPDEKLRWLRFGYVAWYTPKPE